MVEAQAQDVDEMKWDVVQYRILGGRNVDVARAVAALVPPYGKHVSHDLNGTDMDHESYLAKALRLVLNLRGIPT